MKRILITLAGAAALGLLAGCGGSSASSPAPAQSAPQTSAAQAASASEKKILVAYFTPGENMGLSDSADAVSSASIRKYEGHTTGDAGVIAHMIAKETDGTLHSIKTEKVYPADYQSLVDIGQEEKGENARPVLTSTLEGLENYDTVFLVYPMWWHDLPMAVHTFLDTYDFSGKTIIPYALHGGGGPENSSAIIAEAEPEAKVAEAGEYNGYFTNDLSVAEPAVAAWLKNQGF